MKSNPSPQRGPLERKSPPASNRSGIAIITVLSVLLLMSVLMLGFFSGASSELETSRYYASSLRSRQLADIVSNMVVSQIREATTLKNLGGQKTTWSSQPGLITTFTNAPTPNYRNKVVTRFKLYSSRDMEATAQDVLTGGIPNDWQDNPQRWADLNEPVWSDRDQLLYFPILDPRAYRGFQKPQSIEGFTYDLATSSGAQVVGTKPPTGTKEDEQRLPMPVEWLYLLDDGTVGYLDDNDSFVTSEGGNKPTSSNPITARVAFWTDDESTKININTAAEGVPWDTPRYSSAGEKELGNYQPAQREYYRYQGHPATVCMSSVLYPHKPSHKDIIDNKAILQGLLQLSPRNTFGGTEGGTKVAQNAVELDDHRLYSTVDELLYRQGGLAQTTAAGDEPRVLNEVFANTNAGSTAPFELFKVGRHLLTANSNAPELTLLGTPKMSMWPLPVSGGSVYDRLIGYCTNIGGRPYYWRRDNANSRHWEVYGNLGGDNLELVYYYLNEYTNERLPGYGGRLNEKYGGASVASDNFQILTQCWDTMRTTNLLDPMGVRYGNESGQIASGCLCGGKPSGSNHATAMHRDRWDKSANPAKGFGRLYGVTEATLVFRRKGAVDGPDGTPAVALEVGVLLEVFCPAHGFTKIRPETFMQINGPPSVDRNRHGPTDPIATIGEDPPVKNALWKGNRVILRATQGLNGTLNIGGDRGGDMNGRGTALETRFRQNLRTWGGHGGPLLFSNTPIQFSPHRQVPGEADMGSGQGNEVWALRSEDGTIAVNPGRWRIIMYDDNDTSNGNLIQMSEIQWPSFKIPVPAGSPRGESWLSRLRGSRENLIQPGDVTRSMVVSHGDYRLTMANRVTRANEGFKPHFRFNETTAGADGATSPVNHAHSLTDMDGYKFHGFTVERFMIPGAKYADSLPNWDGGNEPDPEELRIIPDFPISPANDLVFAPYAKNPRGTRPGQFPMDPAITGDWDQGIGFHLDGPYIGRVDDGSAQGDNPYFDIASIQKANEPAAAKTKFFSPNRMIAGPGQYGSMPTGVRSDIPWRTLLFRPDTEHYGSHDQPKKGGLPDHLYMDMWWMPVVEPYAISMPFATRGKINLNYQIIPWDNIKRATALHALLKGERVVAIPTEEGANYKKMSGSGGNDSWRHEIDAYETLKQAEHRFAEGEVFRSPTEICELYLVPKDEELGDPVGDERDYPDMRKFWKEHQLTGDNTKERPYANLQPRLTTKSNVFKVHMIVQTLKKARRSPPESFNVERDKVTGQWRGSAVIERYIDPSDPRIPNYVNPGAISTQPSLENFYSYRVVDLQQFAP